MPDINPPPSDLYSLTDLISGFDPANETSVLQTLSFRQYQAYYPIKLAGANDLERIRAASDHDARISESLFRYLKVKGKRPVGIMGGHSVSRDEPAYIEVAKLARVLTLDGFLIVTGGGPGIMEAAHVGALFANASDAEFSNALELLGASSQKRIPFPSSGMSLLNEDGTLTATGDPIYTKHLFDWFLDAYRVRDMVENSPGESLAVSTWEYGEEPVMPFATAYAAYFQNSIREASLVREARAGIVYGKGGGGTVREIFQDVEENYYVQRTEDFTPMIFFDPSGYWNPSAPNANSIKLDTVIPIVFSRAFAGLPAGRIDWSGRVLFSTDIAAIRRILKIQEVVSEPKFLELFSREATIS